MPAYYNEIDKKAAAWLRELISAGHIAAGEVDERSILEVRPDDLRGFTQCHFFAGIGVWSHALRSAGWADDRPVWTGSCPCQPFSAAGKGDEFADERHLWPVWFRLIRECRPVAVFGEQVASKDALTWLDHVSTDLEGEGYTFGAIDSCAAGFGAPHIRQRLYFVADSGRSERRPQSAGGSRHARHGREAVLGGRNSDGTLAGADGCGAIGIVGHASGRGLGIQRDEAQPRRGGHADGAEQHGVDLGDTIIEGLEGHRGHADDRNEPGRIGEDETRPATAAGPTNGFWSAADWLPCRDGKARPTEPGTFPLAHGAAERVGRLRGYGNAICAPVAAEFVRAFLGAHR